MAYGVVQTPEGQVLHLIIAKRPRRYRFQWRAPAWLATAWQHQRALLGCRLGWACVAIGSGGACKAVGGRLKVNLTLPFVTTNSSAVWKFSDHTHRTCCWQGNSAWLIAIALSKEKRRNQEASTFFQSSISETSPAISNQHQHPPASSCGYANSTPVQPCATCMCWPQGRAKEHGHCHKNLAKAVDNWQEGLFARPLFKQTLGRDDIAIKGKDNQASSIVPDRHCPSVVVAPKQTPMWLAGRTTMTLKSGSWVSFDWNMLILGNFGSLYHSHNPVDQATLILSCRLQ